MRIFHIAIESDWRAAKKVGQYAVSTRGRTLAEEGFIHASRADQWQAVRSRFYADVDEPMVLLVIDTDLLEAPVVEEPAVPGGDETFPHIYGVLNVDAVVNVLPVEITDRADRAPDPTRPQPSMSRLFLEEMMLRLALATAVILLASAVGFLAELAAGPTVALIATLSTLVVAGAVAFVLTRRRDQHYKDARSRS